ncbi:MAG: bifunctional ADP-dependent NAD(P)H-hydrate dehydratase/NAD(P)H-hydrate epimerase [bacterium]|nr:bifunctional ADP-dependent NAD(P)H-hydrate dehydratase/NAD(P)H-hydrate epimerase [bacterium]
MELAAKLLRFADCRALDAASIAAGLPERQLMGQAALASFYALDSSGALARSNRVIILCGPGNNGGDGYALGYMLAGAAPESAGGARQSPLSIEVYASAPPKSEAARFYAERLHKLCEPCEGRTDDGESRPRSGRAPRVSIGDAADFLRMEPEALHATDCLMIEALLGIGQNEAPRGTIARVLAHITNLQRQTGVHTVSLDVPVGLREDAPADDARELLVPDEIHSYGVDKAALRLEPRIAAGSLVRVLAMGFLPGAQYQTAADTPVIQSLGFAGKSREPLRALTDRPSLAHKYQAGHGLLIGGSPGMEGALMMAARAFFAAGGGILHAIVPNAESRKFLTTALPGVMFLDHSKALPDSLRPRSIAIGPGLAPEDLEATIELLAPLFARMAPAPETNDGRKGRLDAAPAAPWLILDAGALAFAKDARFPESLRARSILTPHTGEWKRLGGAPIDCVNALEAAARMHAREIGGYCLVKDAVSALLPPNHETPIGIRHRPNPALAVAGSGDNLCGILTALFARRDDSGAAFSPVQKIAAALEILDGAARLEHHPRADQFPDLIRRSLESGAGSDAAGREDRPAWSQIL